MLPPPTIEYSGDARENSRDGAWNMRGKRFNSLAQCKSWAVISMCDPRRCNLGDILKFFKAVIARLVNLIGNAVPSGVATDHVEAEPRGLSTWVAHRRGEGSSSSA